MSATTKEIIDLLDMLPQKEQDFACEMLRKIVLAWDPDFTKLTSDEARRLNEGRRQLVAGDFLRDSEIDWDNFDNMNFS